MFTAGAKINRAGVKCKASGKWIHRPDVQSGLSPARSILRRVAAEDAPSSAEDTPQSPPAEKVALADIVTGQTYSGVVKAVAAYGCFVDIGATTDGLVHISQLANEYVRDVNSFVSVGQEVKVKVIGVEGEGKLSLSMKDDSAEAGRSQKRQERRVPRAKVVKEHGLTEGDKVKGEVMRVAGFGAFLKLADGFEVLLPTAEMSATEDLDPNPHKLVTIGNMMDVTVLKVDGSKVSVTAISDEDRASMAEASKGASSSSGTSAAIGGSMFNDLAALGLEGMFAAEPAAAAAPADPEVEEVSVQEEAATEVPPAAEEAAAATAPAPAVAEDTVPEPTSAEPVGAAAPAAATEPAAAAAPAAAAEPAAAAPAAVSAGQVRELRTISGAGMMDCKKALQECGGDVQAAQEYLRKKGLASADKKAGRVAAEGVVTSYIHAGSRLGVLVEVNCETDFVSRGDIFKEFAADMAMQVAACPDVKVVSVDDVPTDDVEKEREIEMQKEDLQSKPENVCPSYMQIREKIVDGRIAKIKEQQALLEQGFIRAEDGSTVADAIKAKIVELGENITLRRFTRYELGEGLAKKDEDFAAEVAAQTEKKDEEPAPPKQEETKDPVEEKPAIKVDAKLVKELRASSGAGMMDCKSALAANDNDLEKASVWLKKKGLASADKKAGRIAAEGVVASYIHAGSSLGVLIEVNCETDFVAKGEVLQELAADMAMQVAANQDIQYVSVDSIPQSIKDAEQKIESAKDDLQGKPEAQIPRIVEGRVNKTMTKMCLLDQEFIKDTNKKVEVVIKEAIAATGENIKVRRFTRFVLGEGIEKKSDDFAAEVAAQTGQA